MRIASHLLRTHSYSVFSISTLNAFGQPECHHLRFGNHTNALRHNACAPQRLFSDNRASTSPIVQPRRYLAKDTTKDKKSSASEPKSQLRSNKSPEPNQSSPVRKSTAHKEPAEPVATNSKIPNLVTDYPTPIISRSKFDKYLKPLYQLGWSIEYRYGKTGEGTCYPVASLQLHFEKLDWGRFFILGKLVRDFERSERHRAEWKYTGTAVGMDFKGLRELGHDLPPTISLLLRTRNAVLPSTPNALARPDEAFAHIPRTLQGITLRDIRFAMLLSEALTKYNTKNPKALQFKYLNWQDVKINSLQPKSVETLILGPPIRTTVAPGKTGGMGKAVEQPIYTYVGGGWANVLDTDV